jgi:hypothetical protein
MVQACAGRGIQEHDVWMEQPGVACAGWAACAVTMIGQVANSTSTAPVNKVATLISMAISPRNKA